MSDLNTVQELFLLSFSILFGTMVQSLTGLMPFPLGRVFGGYKGRKGKINKVENCAQKRMKQTYTELKIKNCTFEDWKNYIWLMRLLSSFTILNLLPILYFSIVVLILRKVNFMLNPLVNIFGTFWLSLNIFTFHRIYICLTIWKRTSHFFCDLDLDNRRISHNIRSHMFLSFLLYVVLAMVYIIHIVITYY